MFVTSSLGINYKGHLTIGGCDAVELAAAYGTPLYVMDEQSIRNHCRVFRQSMHEYYDGRGLPIYASKAFICLEICRIMAEEGMGLDVVSGGELYTALKAGFPAERIVFHGNNKTSSELTMALENGVGCIVVDNLDELRRLEDLSGAMNVSPGVMLRIKPGVDAHTHSFIKTGQIDSKFGFALETGEAFAAAKEVLAQKNLRLKGVHCHIGSQIFEIEPFRLAARRMIDLIAKIKAETGAEIEELNLGGGFGIRYLKGDEPKLYKEFMKQVSEEVKTRCREQNVTRPFVSVEPGRAIVGPAGTTLYTVGSIKTIPDVRTYVSVDGGMTDNPRYALYQSSYTAVVANKATHPFDFEVTIAGKCCESGDLIQENIKIQQAEPGDIMGVFCTGAYNYSMSSNYNRIPRPPVVMIRDGVPRVIVRGETYEDLIRNDV